MLLHMSPVIWWQLSCIVELLVTNIFKRFAGGEYSGNDKDKKKER